MKCYACLYTKKKINCHHSFSCACEWGIGAIRPNCQRPQKLELYALSDTPVHLINIVLLQDEAFN